MSEFLLARAIASPRISHFLYWNLKLLQTSDVKFRTCSSMMLWALKNLIGTARSMEFANQVQKLSVIYQGSGGGGGGGANRDFLK